MTGSLLDGKGLAAQLRSEIAAEVTDWTERGGPVPKLVAVLVGEDPASAVYVRNKHRACEQVGIASHIDRLPTETPVETLLERVAHWNAAADVHGILVQLPLPPALPPQAILDAIDPWKDVDAFHPENVGLLVQGRPRFLPCTPHGVLQLLHRNDIPVAGRHVVVIGRSDIVGKPLANMLAQKDSALGPSAVNATVTLCHSRTADLTRITQEADIIVAAIGQPRFLTAEMVRPGAVVVDVGINRVGEALVGDVDFAPVAQRAAHITPVPGGVGPLTIAMLLRNTLHAARLQHERGREAAAAGRPS